MIIYVWKILNGVVPNIAEGDRGLEETFSLRGGKKCKIPSVYNRAPAYVQTIKYNSFAVYAPKLFNCIPREVRELAGDCDVFKRQLDLFLCKIPGAQTKVRLGF